MQKAMSNSAPAEKKGGVLKSGGLKLDLAVQTLDYEDWDNDEQQ